MTQTLVILAAGMGSRFGGPKQLEPLGSNGETIVDFSIYDALRSGFGAIALVVRRAMLDAFERSVCARWLPHVRVELCFQEMNDLPPPFTAPAGRSRPWGTAHALLRAENTISGPFGVINADDFYGISAFRTLSSFLQEAVSSGATLSATDHESRITDHGPGTTDHVSGTTDHVSRITDHAVVSFPLRHTVGDGEPVNRALLRVSPDGWLQEIEEITVELDAHDGCYHTSDRRARTIPGDAPISMNMWGFNETVFAPLKAQFRDFIAKQADAQQDAGGGRQPEAKCAERDSPSEFLLPDFVASMIREGRARVRVLRGDGEWCGMTHPGDRARAARFLRMIVQRGDYPAVLW